MVLLGLHHPPPGRRAEARPRQEVSERPLCRCFVVDGNNVFAAAAAAVVAMDVTLYFEEVIIARVAPRRYARQ